MPLNPGTVINNRYRIVSLLGQGGFGAVYRAWDLSLKKPCAVKQNFETSPQAQKQFEREAVILARLNHPNLPRVTDHFSVPGEGQYLVMDYVEGEDLQEVLDRSSRPLPERLVLPWIEQVCEALTYLHNQTPPIIHRDIKPANIKITPEGKAVLVDFGIAKVFDPLLKTTIGARAITPGYSPLEQYGQGRTDSRSDIYALGAMLYALLTGRELPESTQRAVNDTVIPANQLNPNISRPVVVAIHHAIQVDAARRPASVSDFKTALHVEQPQAFTRVIAQQTVSQPTQARYSNDYARTSQPPVPQTSSLPRWLPWAGLGAAGLVIIILISSVTGSKPEPTRDPVVVIETVVVPATDEVSDDEPKDQPTNTLLPVPTDTSPPEPTQSLPTNTTFPTASPVPPASPTLTLSPTPQLPSVMIEAYCDMFGDSPVYVEEHQPVIIWWRWDAKTAYLVQDHLDTARYEIYLDGQRISAVRQTSIEYLSNKGWYRVSWFADARVLPPGSHRAERYLSWDRWISDGWDTFGPGGETETEWDYCDIIVSGN
jgi:serine/threonine protein kinase